MKLNHYRNSAVVDIFNGDAQIQLSVLDGDGKIGTAVNVIVDSVDEVYHSVLKKGLDISGFRDSPVHQAPIDQTWGSREFYVRDPDGNTIRFRQLLR